MKFLCLTCFAVSLAFAPSFGGEQPEGHLPLKGLYLGQRPPGSEPEVFAPGVLDQISMIHGRITFSPDGREVYWSCNAAPVQSRWHMSRDSSGVWCPPEASFLSLEHSENAIAFSPDGRRMYFHSRRPAGRREGDNKDIWYRERDGAGWGEAVNPGAPVNTAEYEEGAPAVASDGTLYFCREARVRRHGAGGDEGDDDTRTDIYRARFVGGTYAEPERLGPEVNSAYHDIEPAVAPDESYLVFTSNRPGGYSAMMNLYVCFRTADGGWTEALCLSDRFEIANIWFPSITPDGRYLFFCGGYPTGGGYTESDYYWVDTRAIETLRPAASP